MNQPVVSVLEPIILGAVNVALVEGAARDLEGFSEEIQTPGHSPSWSFPQVPDGLALCVGCWRLIAARQLGGERCPGTERRAPDKEHRPKVREGHKGQSSEAHVARPRPDRPQVLGAQAASATPSIPNASEAFQPSE
jgi:hypothetical protein